MRIREYSEEFQEKMMDMMGFCNCGMPNVVISQMYEYLKEREHPIETPDEDLLMAYTCDALGLTDHGGSVYSAWINSKGKELLKEMEEAEEDYGEEEK